MEKLDDVFSFESNRLVETKQAAHYLGFRVSYIYNLVHLGKLRAFKCGNRKKGSLRFLKGDLDAFLGRGGEYVDQKTR